MEPILKAYINEAIEVEKAGLKVNFKMLDHQLKKLCYVSSIAAIGHHTNPEQLIDEETKRMGSIENINKELEPFHATLEKTYLTFESEAHYNWFVLRWA